MLSGEMTIEVTEKREEENPCQVEEKAEILEVAKEVEGHLNEEKDVVGNEADGGGEVVEEQVEENVDEHEEVNEEKDGKPDEEAVEEGSQDEEEAEGENEENVGDEGKQTEDEKTPTTGAKKRSRKGGKRDTEQLQSPRPGSDRPSRERKTVERYIVPETARLPYGKPVSIEKGRGTQLKDIPNVAFKLSKRKADENLQLLHTILFGRKAKVHSLKRNISLFSGFVWIENEQEKQRSKIKEKLDKCIKEKLLDFCDILNISVNKATTKKEELSAKLLEFLESPHATTDTVLADKEKIKRRRSKGSASKSPGSSATDGVSAKKQKLDSESGKHSSDEDDKSESLRSEDEQHDDEVRGAESDTAESEKTEDQDEPKEKRKVDTKISKETTKQKSPSVKLKPVHKESSSKTSKAAVKSVEKSKGKAHVPPSKKQKVETDPNSDPKTVSKKKRKDKEDDESSKVAKKEPTRSELSAEVVNILQKVDFNTATLSDILRQLGDHFDVNLIDRKREIKELITEAIQNMSDGDDEEENEEEEEGDEHKKNGENDE